MSDKPRAPRGSLTAEEARLRKNERQLEYAKRTGYAANKRYEANNPDKGVQIKLKLQRPRDDDVIEKLMTVEKRADYIRRLVRNDIEKQN